ncbi:MAG: hypothetical protein HOV68_12275, partial [Streptomycetaceae bacterium]|nr:hypothetical protein [Streptomycetaceae bacterium]
MTELSWETVLATHKRHGIAALPPLFADLTEAERRTLAPAVKQAVKELRDVVGKSRDIALLRVAGAACIGGSAGVSQWLARRDLQWDDTGAAIAEVVSVLMRRQPDWIPDIVERLIRRVTAESWPSEWGLVDRLARTAGLPAPTHEQYVIGWFAKHSRNNGGRLVDALRADAYALDLLPRIFDVEQLGRRIDDSRRWAEHWPERDWPWALKYLTAAGVIERGTILDAFFSRMLRGVSSVADARGFLLVYEVLEVTDDELASRSTTLLRLLPDAPSTVASAAQAALRRLDEAGRLDAEQVAEACTAAFFRPEKKLVRAQFTWLDKAVKRHPDRVGDLLATVPTVFTQSAADLHDRALKSLDKHLPKLPDAQATAVRGELRAVVDALTGPARAQVAALLGEEVADPEPADVPQLPPYVPGELPAEVASLDELVEEIAAFLANNQRTIWTSAVDSTDPWTVERLVDALLREAARDREALRRALEPLDERYGRYEHAVLGGVFPAEVGTGVWALYRAARGKGDTKGWFRSLFSRGDKGLLGRRGTIRGAQLALMSRLCEVAERLRTPEQGPHLARPATASGFVDPAELVHGLAQYEATGRIPWRRDLDQALLRLPRSVDAATLGRARALTSPAGVRATHVMAAGGMPDPKVFLADRSWTSWATGARLQSQCAMPGVGPVPEAFSASALAGELCDREPAYWDGLADGANPDMTCWPLLAPGHRDVIA